MFLNKSHYLKVRLRVDLTDFDYYFVHVTSNKVKMKDFISFLSLELVSNIHLFTIQRCNHVYEYFDVLIIDVVL